MRQRGQLLDHHSLLVHHPPSNDALVLALACVRNYMITEPFSWLAPTMGTVEPLNPENGASAGFAVAWLSLRLSKYMILFIYRGEDINGCRFEPRAHA